MPTAPGTPRGQRAMAAAPLIAGIALAALALAQLSRALPQVANRHAFAWDSARRATLDVQAADALRRLDLASFLWYVAGPETWPTLRLTLAAPLHALAGTARALTVEHGLSLVITAALAVGLGLAARSIAPRPGSALLVLGVSAAGLAGNRMLLTHAANGMLEPLSALLTLGATAAWIGSRERDVERPWSVALLGNLLFHSKWQHGLFFAGAVLAVEVAQGGGAAARNRMRAVLAALRGGVRTRLGAALLALTAALAAAVAAVVATGGGEARVLGLRVTMRDANRPVALAALALFALVQVALWRDRRRLAIGLPVRLRFLWTWLATPMAAWLLVPFTWRLRTIADTAASFDSGERSAIGAGRLLYYLRGAWASWAPPGARETLAALLLAAAIAAARSPEVRRRLTPIAALAALEWFALTVVSRHNYQARFIVNLAPLAYLAASAWIPVVTRPIPRAALALGAAAAIAWPAAPLWRPEALAGTMAGGFDPASFGDDCRAVARRLTASRAVLINGAPMSHRQGCMLWVELAARERKAQVDVDAGAPRPGWDEAIVIAEGCSRLSAPFGFARAGPEVESGSICGRRYVRVASASR